MFFVYVVMIYVYDDVGYGNVCELIRFLHNLTQYTRLRICVQSRIKIPSQLPNSYVKNAEYEAES